MAYVRLIISTWDKLSSSALSAYLNISGRISPNNDKSCLTQLVCMERVICNFLNLCLVPLTLN